MAKKTKTDNDQVTDVKLILSEEDYRDINRQAKSMAMGMFVTHGDHEDLIPKCYAFCEKLHNHSEQWLNDRVQQLESKPPIDNN